MTPTTLALIHTMAALLIGVVLGVVFGAIWERTR